MGRSGGLGRFSSGRDDSWRVNRGGFGLIMKVLLLDIRVVCGVLVIVRVIGLLWLLLLLLKLVLLVCVGLVVGLNLIWVVGLNLRWVVGMLVLAVVVIHGFHQFEVSSEENEMGKVKMKKKDRECVLQPAQRRLGCRFIHSQVGLSKRARSTHMG